MLSGRKQGVGGQVNTIKVYNKKGLILGIFWTVLAVWNLLHDFFVQEGDMAVQIRGFILSLVLLSLGVRLFRRAFSKEATREDIVEELDERNRLVELKSQARMLHIVCGVLFVVMLCGLVGYRLTGNIAWAFIFTIPGVLLGLFLIAVPHH